MSDTIACSALKPSVLVVDDDFGVRTLLGRSLRVFGCRVRTAGSLAEGRAALAAAPVDVLLVDFELPDGIGPDLARAALADARAARAYCITGVATERNVVTALRAGCVEVFEKPIVPSQLRSVVLSKASFAGEA